jgi:hypothetical protein
MINNASTKSANNGRRGDKAAAKRKERDQRIRKLGDSKSAAKIRFTATLFRPAATEIPRPVGEAVSGGWTFLTLPKDASAKLPSRGMVSVEGTLNGSRLRATLEPDGKGGHWLKVDRKMREAAGAEPGDTVTLEVTPVAPDQEPEPSVPPDLRKALAAAPGAGGAKAREVWSDITPAARRDFIHWITSGKRADTRAIRIDKACDMLAKGKRRPCCFDRSGMYDKSLSCPIAEP